MQFISSLHKIQSHHQNAVVTIGNFDGVHIGHQQLISTLKQSAAIQQKASMVITFEPLPAEYFSSADSPIKLMTLREKLHQLKALQIDYALCLKFNRELANLSAQAFINELLIKRLNIAHLIVGKDFRFGHERQGDIALLKRQNPFTVETIEKVQKEKECVSSTRIRAALANNHFELAKQLLGKDYAISGRIIHGQKLGRTLGFPTANIPLRKLTLPIEGVFAVEVLGLHSEPLPGVANIGKKPTLNGIKKLLEVHLLDFDQSIYGRYIQIIPRKKIRDEKKFSDLAALSAQIVEDVKMAKQFFYRFGRN